MYVLEWKDWDLDALHALQLKRLKKTLSLAHNVDFYRKQFKSAGIQKASIKSLDDIKKIPFTRKQDIRDGYPFGFLQYHLNRLFGFILFRGPQESLPLLDIP